MQRVKYIKTDDPDQITEAQLQIIADGGVIDQQTIVAKHSIKLDALCCEYIAWIVWHPAEDAPERDGSL